MFLFERIFWTTPLLFAGTLLAGCATGEDLTSSGRPNGRDAGEPLHRPTPPGDSPSDPTDPTDPTDPSPSNCTGKSGARRGLTMREVTAGGRRRTFLVYAPQNLDPDRPAPVVFLHHGFTMSGQAMHDITQIAALADREGFVVGFPDGQAGPDSLGAPWNVGTNVCGNGVLATARGDDFSFVEAMRADIEADQCVDRDHVFVAGFSMGGYFSHHLGCTRPDLARAIAPHSGGTHDLATCSGGPKPVIMFHGTADTVITVGCGIEARDAWAQKNGCSTEVESRPVAGGRCEWSRGCPADGQVVLCLFDGMGHVWAGGAGGLQSSDPNAESATALMWDFFRRHAW